jgi:hypothetical protein
MTFLYVFGTSLGNGMFLQIVKVVLDDGSSSGNSSVGNADNRPSSSFNAKIVGTDALHDLAVLQVCPQMSHFPRHVHLSPQC